MPRAPRRRLEGTKAPRRTVRQRLDEKGRRGNATPDSSWDPTATSALACIQWATLAQEEGCSPILLIRPDSKQSPYSFPDYSHYCDQVVPPEDRASGRAVLDHLRALPLTLAGAAAAASSAAAAEPPTEPAVTDDTSAEASAPPGSEAPVALVEPVASEPAASAAPEALDQAPAKTTAAAAEATATPAASTTTDDSTEATPAAPVVDSSITNTAWRRDHALEQHIRSEIMKKASSAVDSSESSSSSSESESPLLVRAHVHASAPSSSAIVCLRLDESVFSDCDADHLLVTHEDQFALVSVICGHPQVTTNSMILGNRCGAREDTNKRREDAATGRHK